MASDDGAPEPRYNQVSLLVSFALGVTFSGESLPGKWFSQAFVCLGNCQYGDLLAAHQSL